MIEQFIKIANDIYQNAGGIGQPYTFVNGVWFFNGNVIDAESQQALTSAVLTQIETVA